MRSSRAVARLALTAGGGTAALACGLADVFRPAAAEPVTLTYQGDTVLPLDSAVPFTVIVEAGGVRLSRPRLRITPSDKVALTAGGDSLIGVVLGTATLTIRLESSMFPDTATAPTLAQPLRVKQKP